MFGLISSISLGDPALIKNKQMIMNIIPTNIISPLFIFY